MLFLACCFLLISCQGNVNKDREEIKENTEKNLSGNINNYIDSLLTTLTLEERVGQCLMPSIFSSSDEENISLYKKYIDDFHVGGIVLLQGDMESAKQLAEIGQEKHIPLFIAIDAEWGLGMRLKDARVYPKNGNISEKTEETELFDYGRQIALECRELGVNMVLGPVIDISEGKKGVIGKRSFGPNPDRVSDFGVAYAKGLESGGVISVAKHFPGHGSTIIDSHKGVASIKRDMSELDSLDLKPFKDYVNSGLTGVMAGHIQSLALDPDGNPASVSIDMLTYLLREEMGFQGLILTDAFDMGGAKGFSASEALKAGADLVLCPKDLEKEYYNILESIKNGTLPLEIINERCRKILFIKSLFLRVSPDRYS